MKNFEKQKKKKINCDQYLTSILLLRDAVPNYTVCRFNMEIEVYYIDERRCLSLVLHFPRFFINSIKIVFKAHKRNSIKNAAN